MPKQTRATDQQDQHHSPHRKVPKTPNLAPAGGRLKRLPDNPTVASDVAQLQSDYV